MNNSIKVIVFDLYNTLVRITQPKHVFLNIYKESKNGFDLDLGTYLNLIMTKDLNFLIQELPLEFKLLYTKYFPTLVTELKSVKLYKDTEEILKTLSKTHHLFLISNLASPYKKVVYEYNIDHYFDQIIFSCDFGFVKPSRTIYQTISHHTKAKPEEILMIGDSHKADVLGAKQMGWQYLQIKHGVKPKKDFQIESLLEVISLIKKTI